MNWCVKAYLKLGQVIREGGSPENALKIHMSLNFRKNLTYYERIELYKNLALGRVVEDTTGALVTIGAGETFELDNDLPVKDIKLVTLGGAFDIFVC